MKTKQNQELKPLTIANHTELDTWMNERRRLNRPLFSIKGNAPDNSCYSDGEKIDEPVNVAWRDGITGEIFAIEYEVNL